jgi:hypothetical protein
MTSVEEKNVHIAPAHPDWRGDKSQTFSNSYRLIAAIICPQLGRTPERVTVGRRDFRKCAICEKPEPLVSFETDAHTLASGLGNRHHFSLEECDECNTRRGRLFDQELLNWLKPERVLHRIRRRPGEGPPTLQANDGSRIHIDQTSRAISVVGDANTIINAKLHENEVRLQFPRPAFRTSGALKSLLSTAWLLLSPEERKRHGLARALIRGEVSFAPISFWDLFIPGYRRNAVEFELWEKSNPVVMGASLVLRLSLLNTLLVWELPDKENGYVPSLLPPVEIALQNFLE